MGEKKKIIIDVVKKAQSRLSLHGKQAVVVGGTSGIGHAMAVRLARANASVTILGRNREVGKSIVEEMKQASLSVPEIIQKNPTTLPAPKFSFMECDASLLTNVREVSNQLQARLPKIDYLICGQGIATTAGRTETKEGLEQKLALHFYSRYAFAYYLANHMMNSADPRFISILSGGVHKSYRSFQTDPELHKHFSLKNMADATGMYNDFACDALSRKYPKIAYTHIAPGFVATGWGREMPFYLKPILSVLKRFARSKEDCAEFMCRTIFTPDFKAPGYYILDQYAEPAATTNLHTRENVDWWWNHTEAILKKY